MKRCPTCNKTFTDRNLSFCIEDGTPLVEMDSPDEITRVAPRDEGGSDANETPSVPAYRPPSYVPMGTSPERKRKAWPWVLGILGLLLLVIVGMGIAAAIFVPKLIKEAVNNNTSNTNNNRSERGNSNWNSNSNLGANQNGNDNTSTDGESAPAPTDEALVLSQLTDIENEWTVANINADKKKLNRILADDYAGTTDGKTQGKADYLRNVQRDTSIQKWEFEDLKVDLNGDRATLSGIINLQIDNKPVSFNFTDKFVWRDGRWQAIGSEVTPVK